MPMNNIIITNNEPEEITVTQNENQTIIIDGGGNVIGITDVLVNGVSVVSGNKAFIIVPTKTSELTNDSGFITAETDPTVPTVVKNINTADINNWNNKQNQLVSGSNIKTINDISLLGSGNLQVGGVNYSAGTGIDITEDVISNTITSYDDLTDLPTIPSKTSDLINDNDFVSENQLADVAFDGSYTSLSNTPTIPDSTSQLVNDSNFIDSTQLATDLATKQDTLVSGTNIKTINGVSVLGAGDIIVTGGSATDVQINGTSITSGGIANIVTESAYNASTNKIATKSDIPTNTSQLTNNSNFAVTNSDNNFSTNQTISGNLTVNGLEGNVAKKQKIENINFNDLPSYRSGLYEIYATSNDPSSSQGSWWHVIQIVADDGAQWVYQEAISWYGTFEKYARRRNGATWENWIKVW